MAKPKAMLIKITIISIISVLLIVGLSGYVLIYSYIRKMNIVKDTEEQVIEEVELELEAEDENNQEINSLEDEILAIEEKIRTNMEEKSTPIKEDKDVLNILLIGSDSRKTGGTGRSDAMILISINKSKKEIVASSLLRDIYLQIPGKGNNRLNAAYAFGGANLLLDTIEENFKVKVDKYAAVDFYSFMRIEGMSVIGIDFEKNIEVMYNEIY